MDHTVRSPEVPDGQMVDNSDQPTQLRSSPDDGDHGRAEGTMDHHLGREPYAVRVRIILLLSLLCWSVMAAALALIFA